MFPVVKMCQVFKLSTSGYYKWIKQVPSKQKKRRTMLLEAIKVVHKTSKKRYGSPRITKELQTQNIIVSENLVAKIMKQNDIRSIVQKRYKVTTDSSHKYPVVENILDRNFTTKEPNKVWVSDITYVATEQGWLYLTSVIDLFDRQVIGWALSNTMKAKETTVAALKMAKINRPIQPYQQLIFHSDRGIQYACEEFASLFKNNENITRSMSRKGNCWDNAVAESFFKTLKTELIYHEKYKTRQQAELSIFEYIETFYNKNRRHSQLKNLTIKEYNQLFNNNLKNVA
jgi:transposase InsO family protein